jgi:hypothetical protein
VLCGWTAHGTRPTFDVVTGSSSGSLLAVYAFLGPKYDPQVRRFFTETRDHHLFCFRPTLHLLCTGSFASPGPLRRLLAAQVTDEMLDEIRAAHACGRRLFVSTLDTRAKRLVVWDLGAIASGGRPDAGELVRKVLLAACSIPGVVPPVEFEVEVDGVKYKEQHADGGPVTQSFVRVGPVGAGPPEKWLAGANVYFLAAGKLYADPLVGKMWLLGRLASAVSAALHALYRAELVKSYALCLTSGANFHLIAIPQDLPIPPRSMSAPPREMKRLFDCGYRTAAGGIPWRHLPPGSEPDEQEVPRAGLTFETK